MLFSHPQLATYMSEAFECAWESVRPVPRVTIDFGTGHTLERTLHGNIVTYFCLPSGEVFDLLPGLVDAQEYSRRLAQAQRLNRARGVIVPPLIDTTFRGSPPNPVPADPPREDRGRRQILDWHQALIWQSGSEPLERDPLAIFDGSKMRVERKLDASLLPPLAAGDAESLRLDTLHNRVHRYPLASRVFLDHPFARPADITREVYRKLLGVDLDDPYLGLAPEVLGGEVGRH